MPATLTELLVGMATAIHAAAAKAPNALQLVDEQAQGYQPLGLWTAGQHVAFFALTPAERLEYFASGQPYRDYEAAKGLPGEVADEVVKKAEAAAKAAADAASLGLGSLVKGVMVLGVGWLALQFYKATKGSR